MMNMSDRELLEMAAKAAGMPSAVEYDANAGLCFKWGHGFWNPLNSDGDAMRLAVKRGCFIYCFPEGDYEKNGDFVPSHTEVFDPGRDVLVREFHGEDADAATRRAIVRAVAGEHNGGS
jgi:hypothetical protein